MSGRTVLNVGLASLCLALGAILAVQIDGTMQELAFATGARPAPTSASGPADNLLMPSMPEPSAFAEIAKRPLFHADRRQAQESPDAASAGAVPPPYSLLGILLSADGPVAYLRSEIDGEQVRLRQGDRLNGWTLEKITADSISFVARGLRVRLVLGEPDKTPK